MTVFLTDKPEEFQRFAFSLGETVKIVTSTYELYDFVTSDKQEQLVIIGPGIKTEIGCSIAEHFRTLRPSLGVILLRSRLDVGVMSEAIRSGVREVISIDDAGALVNALNRSLEISSKLLESGEIQNSRSRKAKVLIVFSAKGGCGKTTVSVNLAYALASNSDTRVLLMDLDLQFGDVAVALQVDPHKTISDSISMQTSLDSTGVNSLITKHLENLDLLLAPTNPTDVEFISADLVDRIIDSVKDDYDYIVVDTPPAFTDVILKVFDQADKCFLLSTLDMPSLKNLKIVISTLEALNFNRSRLELVLNRGDLNTGISKTEAETMIGDAFSVSIPSSNEVSSSTNRGTPIVQNKPKHPVSRAIKELADRTHSEFHPRIESKRSWFGRSKK